MTDMIEIQGRRFTMGSDRHYPEEGPAVEVIVDSFALDVAPVTNSAFGRFVADTGYVTLAERAPDPADYPGMPPEMAQPGSLVFVPPASPVDLTDPHRWWQFVFGADWRHPYGPDSSIAGLDEHPVVQIACEDAEAYARWAGKRLPTEAEWELAARAGLNGADFAWGDQLQPGGALLANYWHGAFPWQNLAPDGHSRTSPVGTYPANDYGLYDMIGNVWEWTADWFRDRHARADTPCCAVRNPRGGPAAASTDPCTPQIGIPRRVLKGGSHLCAPNYCQRYRPAARYPQPVDTSTTHVGFRCAR